MTQQNEIPVRPLVSSTRETLDLTLEIKEGQIPNDLQGYVFINTPNGTVNSALPYPKINPDGSHNQEYSSPLLGGGGYVQRFDLTTPGVVKLKSKLLKPPSFYADEATKQGTSLHKILGFKNMGIARLSFVLGAAEQIATAIVPVKFQGDNHSRLLATADLGRAYEFDAENLEVIAPVGKLRDYKAGTPDIVPWIFKLIQGTAHPTFDPVTKEFFTVNYVKSVETLLYASGLLPLLQRKPELLEKLLEEAIDEWEEKNGDTFNFENFLETIEKKIDEKDSRLWRVIQKLIDSFKDKSKLEDEVYLMKFIDRTSHNTWRVIDEQGKNIRILQCMHQTSLSQNYILLIDAAFKLSLDILLNNPFPNNPKIDAFIRKNTTLPQIPDTPLYIIKRSDLIEGQETVTAKKLTLKPEFIHFTADYDDENGNLITLYTASNAAACLAEWVRYYDKIYPNQPIEEGTEGILCVGSMDVGRVGKVVINPENASIKEEVMTYKTGHLQEGKDIGPHTWLAGFYTFRDFISAEKPVNKIKNIYWQFGALEQRRLTQFIFNLYENYENRIVPAEQIKEYSEKGVPLQIARLNTDTMDLEDYYQYPDNYTLGAIQFIPRKIPKEGIDPSMDGYLFTTMINGLPTDNGLTNYVREVWIFDASNLEQGPLCKLTHPQFNFGFTLHSLWVENIEEVHLEEAIHKEYENLLDEVKGKYKKPIKRLFEDKIYPNIKK